MTVRTWATPRESLDRLVRCATDEVGTAMWWACLARHLDELREELAQSDIAGLAAQITADAPQLAATARRLPDLDVQVQCEVAQFRAVVAELSGSVADAGGVRVALEVLLRRVRTLYRVSDDLMLDAYERDFGGE